MRGRRRLVIETETPTLREVTAILRSIERSPLYTVTLERRRVLRWLRWMEKQLNHEGHEEHEVQSL